MEEQERYLRRNNVILVGFLENPNENLKEAMGTLLSDKLKIPSSVSQNISIGKLREGQNRPIFLSYNAAADKVNKIQAERY